jgi:cell wall-associated NlpC family hydrolase
VLKGKSITVTYLTSSIITCLSIVIFLNSTNFSAMAQQPAYVSKVDISTLTPVQQALYKHIQNLENPEYRHSLIFKRIEKLLEESYTANQLQFADSAFIPEAGEAIVPKDIVVTDSAVVLKRYANIPDGTDSNRLKVLNTGACIVGVVPYFWGGKASRKGWNSHWGQDVIVSSGSFIAEVAAEGSAPIRYANAEHTEVLIPYGLDCSGFVDWTYWTALGYHLGGSTRQQWANSNPITAEELLPGDLGFLCSPSDPSVNHVGMYIGKDDNGKMMWLHCSSNAGVNISSPKFIYYRRPNIDIYYKD